MNTVKKIWHNVSPTTLLVVLLVPLLAFGLGTWALKDRASSLDQVPAAVVNLDEGANITVDGKEQFVPFGRLVAGTLTQPGTVTDAELPEVAGSASTGFDWQLATEADANAGLANGDYSAVVVIPADFSEKLATMGTDNPQQATLIVNTNDASGLVDSLLGQAISQAVVSGFNSQMSGQYLDGIYLGFNQIGEGVGSAAEGASELATGVDELSSGTLKLADGAKELNTATTELDNGTNQLSAGANELSSGAGQLANGAGQLAAGMEQFNAQMPQLSSGVDQLSNASNQLADGSQQLSAATSELASGADQLAAGSAELAMGIDQLASAVNTGSNELPALRDASAQLLAGVQGNGSATNPGLVAGAEQMAAGTQQLVAGMQQAETELSGGLQTGVDQVFTTGQNGAPSFADSLAQLAQNCLGVIAVSGGDPTSPAAQQYCAGISQLDAQGLPGVQQALKNQVIAPGVQLAFNGDGTANNPGLIPGAQQLQAGAELSAQQAPQLVAGIAGINTGITQVGDGLTQLSTGANVLNSGAQRAANGSNQLAAGMSEIADGNQQLADGANALNSGVQEAAAGVSALNAGAAGVSEGASGLAAGMGQFNSGVQELAAGTNQLNAGMNEFSTGASQLADGSQQAATGANELAEGLDSAAKEIPSYDEDQRKQLVDASTSPVVLDTQRENEVNGGATATFPFAAALGLWLGAFGIFLIWPALNRRLLDSAIPMWQVVLRSLIPALLVSIAQAALVLLAMVAFKIQVQSPLAVVLIVVASALTFTLAQHMLLTLFGNKLGRVLSLLVLVLQAVSLAGILPLESAPALLQGINQFMPMSISTQGLIHASLGGSVLSTTTVLVQLALFGVASFIIALVASRKARLQS